MTRDGLRFDELDTPPVAWRDVVDGAPDRTFFHRWVWPDVYARHHRGRPRFLAAHRDGAFVGGLPFVEFRRGPTHYVESLPMGTYGGPLVAPAVDDANTIRQGLIDAFAERSGSTRCVRRQLTLRHPDVVDSSSFHRSSIHRVSLDEDYEGFWFGAFSGTRRKECNRAARNGVVARVNAGAEVVDAYYPLHVAAHERWGLPPHPRGFFTDLLAEDPTHVWFVSVHVGERLLGAHLSFVSGDELVLWHGVTTRDDIKGLYPATMLIRAQAEEAARRGLRALNLGGSGGKSGIHQQKVLLGGEEEAIATAESESAWLGLARRIRRR